MHQPDTSSASVPHAAMECSSSGTPAVLIAVPAMKLTTIFRLSRTTGYNCNSVSELVQD